MPDEKREMTPEEIVNAWFDEALFRDALPGSHERMVKDIRAAIETDRKARREDDECLTHIIETEVRAAVAAERERLAQVFEEWHFAVCIFCGENDGANTDCEEACAAIRRGDDDR